LLDTSTLIGPPQAVPDWVGGTGAEVVVRSEWPIVHNTVCPYKKQQLLQDTNRDGR
jgi:hypothetical protein